MFDLSLCGSFYAHLFFPGSPAILGDQEEGADADDSVSDFNYSENQNLNRKTEERILSWHMQYGQNEDVSAPNYDKEVSHNHIPRLTSGQEVHYLSLWGAGFLFGVVL